MVTSHDVEAVRRRHPFGLAPDPNSPAGPPGAGARRSGTRRLASRDAAPRHTGDDLRLDDHDPAGAARDCARDSRSGQDQDAGREGQGCRGTRPHQPAARRHSRDRREDPGRRDERPPARPGTRYGPRLSGRSITTPRRTTTGPTRSLGARRPATGWKGWRPVTSSVQAILPDAGERGGEATSRSPKGSWDAGLFSGFALRAAVQ
jgi:hypothetical protein